MIKYEKLQTSKAKYEHNSRSSGASAAPGENGQVWCVPGVIAATVRSVYRIVDDSWSTKEDEWSCYKKLAVCNRHQCRGAAGGA